MRMQNKSRIVIFVIPIVIILSMFLSKDIYLAIIFKNKLIIDKNLGEYRILVYEKDALQNFQYYIYFKKKYSLFKKYYGMEILGRLDSLQCERLSTDNNSIDYIIIGSQIVEYNLKNNNAKTIVAVSFGDVIIKNIILQEDDKFNLLIKSIRNIDDIRNKDLREGLKAVQGKKRNDLLKSLEHKNEIYFLKKDSCRVQKDI